MYAHSKNNSSADLIRFWSNVNIWNVNCARAVAFMFDTRTDVLVKVSTFLREKISRPEGGICHINMYAPSKNTPSADLIHRYAWSRCYYDVYNNAHDINDIQHLSSDSIVPKDLLVLRDFVVFRELIAAIEDEWGDCVIYHITAGWSSCAPSVPNCHGAYWWPSMMTSSNGNIFRVTGPLCGEFTGPGEFPTQRPVTRSFDVFFDLRLNTRLSKQPWGWWFETPSWSLWRQCNECSGARDTCRHRDDLNCSMRLSDSSQINRFCWIECMR